MLIVLNNDKRTSILNNKISLVAPSRLFKSSLNIKLVISLHLDNPSEDSFQLQGSVDSFRALRNCGGSGRFWGSNEGPCTSGEREGWQESRRKELLMSVTNAPRNLVQLAAVF